MIYKVINLNERYSTSIKGFGEVYEVVSVENKRHILKKKYGNKTFFLSSNKKHSGRGLDLKTLSHQVIKKGYKLIDAGFVDSPLWKSGISVTGSNSAIVLSLISIFAKIVFTLLVQLERFWESETRSHMIYVVGKKI